MIFSIFQNRHQKIYQSALELYEGLISRWKKNADEYDNILNQSNEQKLELLGKMISETTGSGNFAAQDIHSSLNDADLTSFEKELVEIKNSLIKKIEDILKLNQIYIRLLERNKRNVKTYESVIEDWFEYLRMIYIIEFGGEALVGIDDENAQLDVMRKQADASTKKDEIKKRLMKLHEAKV